MKAPFILITLLCFLYAPSHSQHSVTEYVVGQTIAIESAILNDTREIQIFLPDGYDASETAYPVLYILDGERYFLHGVSLQKSFAMFKQTPGFIVVGISKKPSDRNRNYSTQAAAYLDHLESEVIHWVDAQYRTSKQRMLFGWAFAGGFVFETLITHPDLFDVYLTASPFPLKDKIDRLDSLFTSQPNLDKRLFFTSATHEGMVMEGTQALDSLLSQNALPKLEWRFKELEDETHRSTPFTTLYHGLMDAFPCYPELQFSSLQEFLEAGGLEHVYAYYQKRSHNYGFPKELSDWTMFSITRNAIRAGDYAQFDALVREFEASGFMERLRVNRACTLAEFYLQNHQYDRAIHFFTLLADLHPDSTRPLFGLGDAYKALNKDKKANGYYKKAKELVK